MRANSSWAVLLLAVLCSSCETGPQPKAVVPATPQPDLRPAAIIEPQTVAQFPAPQPVPPESIPPRPPVEYQPPVPEPEPETEPPADTKTLPQPSKSVRAP